MATLAAKESNFKYYILALFCNVILLSEIFNFLNDFASALIDELRICYENSKLRTS